MVRRMLPAVLLLVSLSAFPTDAQTGREYALPIPSGGFEADLDGWSASAEYEIVDDANVAHSGDRCVTGEITEPNTHLTLARTFDLHAGAIYTLSLWARGTNGTKIAVWRTAEDGARENIAQWPNQRPQWRLNTAGFTVEKDAKWTIELIAPSSHGSPAGRIWVDDVQLTGIDVPAPTSISDGVGFNDLATMVPMGDDLCFAWISFRDGWDTLQAARVTPSGDVVENWQLLGGESTYVLAPCLVTSGDAAWLVWAQEDKGDWNIHAAEITENGPGDAILVGGEKGVDANPKAVAYGDELHVCWEASRDGGREIRAAVVTDGSATKPRRVSADGVQSYDPAIVAPEGGPVTAAWTSCTAGNMDIAISRRNGGRWSKPEPLTSAPTLDRHPVLLASGPDLWIAWENANSSGYHVGNNSSRRVAVAKLTAQGLMAPVALKTSALWQRAEGAALALDDVGRLWVAYLKPRNQNAGWETFVHVVTGDTVSPAYRVSAKKGMDRPVSLAARDGEVLVGFQGDEIPNGWQTYEDAIAATTGSDAYLSVLYVRDAPPPAPIALEPYVEPDDEYTPGTLRIDRGEDQPTASITYHGKPLKLLYGDLHEHTDVSVCNRTGDQSIDESYASMRDICRYDFACATDHGYNLNPYLWNYTAKLARANEDPGRFLTFLAEEWTSSIEDYTEKYPEGYYGHRNVIFGDPYWPRWYNSRNRQTPISLWQQFAEEGADTVSIPHQLADTGNVPCDWEQVNEAAQPVAEIFQTRGSYEYEGAPRQAGRSLTGNFIQDAWARGVVIGIIASPDHGGGYGKAAVFAPELTREAVLEAIRKRRTYGTTGAKIFMDVRVDGHLMGEKVERTAGGPVGIEVSVAAPMDIQRIDICRNNEFIYTRDGDGKEAAFEYQDLEAPTDPTYYYVRVIQADEEIAWSSPVWLQPG